MTDTIREQIMAVRASGECNMLDATVVQRYAHDRHMFDLVIFIEERKADYVNLIFHGKR